MCQPDPAEAIQKGNPGKGASRQLSSQKKLRQLKNELPQPFFCAK